MELKAYKGDKNLKDLFVKEIEKHRKADEIVKGSYGEADSKNFKGCAVGCSIYSLNKLLDKKYSTSDHAVYEEALGIPEWLARLEDTIFEGLPTEESQLWPTKFSKTINVGANLEPIKWKFCAFVLKENIDQVLKLKITDELKEQVVKSIQGVLVLHEDAIKTGKFDESAARSAAWSAAESAARSAARSAAESAARSAARSAAESAARSAWSAAESAARSAARSAAWSAWSAAESAARSAAKQNSYSKYAKYLLKLLKETK